MGDLRKFHSAPQLFDEAAKHILGLANQSGETFTVALAGGNTPKGLYERLAAADIRGRFPFEKTHFFWGDERFVPPTDARSNFRMAQLALLDPAGAAPQHIHAVNTSLPSAQVAADDYDRRIAEFFKTSPGKFPAFDLVLLGLGEDGHTASLFPGDPVLKEEKKFAAASRLNTDEPRVTLTFPVINHAKNVIFLVTGESKRKVMKEVLEGQGGYPAIQVKPQGRLFWFVAP